MNSTELSRLGDLVAEHGGTLRRAELLELARLRVNPDLTEGQLASELEFADGELEVDGDTVRLARRTLEAHGLGAQDPDAGQPSSSRPFRRLERLIAVDLETVLRYTERHPDGERTIFQVGALRFGAATWAASAPAFDRFIRLPDVLAERIGKPDLRATIQAQGEDPAAVFAAFLAYIADAEAIVAYNGRAFDFRLLDEALERHKVGKIPTHIRRIDGLYLAVASGLSRPGGTRCRSSSTMSDWPRSRTGSRST